MLERNTASVRTVIEPRLLHHRPIMPPQSGTEL